MKGIAAGLLRLLYRVELRGREHIVAAGSKAVVVVNHVSFLDGALLAAFLPGRPVFAIDTHMATRWWVKPFLALVEALDRKRPRLNSSHYCASRMPSSACKKKTTDHYSPPSAPTY